MRTLWLKTAKKTGFLAFFTAISAKKVLIPCIFRGLRPLDATFHLGEREKPAISGAKMPLPANQFDAQIRRVLRRMGWPLAQGGMTPWL
jgi:hypothetical protein